MPCGSATTCYSPSAPEAMIIAAVRFWRELVDAQRPVLPSMIAKLNSDGAGFLAPAVASTLSLLEAWSGKRFHAGETGAALLTDDERYLLLCLHRRAPVSAAAPTKPSLTSTLQIALRSTRLLVQWIVGGDVGELPRRHHCFAALASDSSEVLPNWRYGSADRGIDALPCSLTS